MNEQEFLEYIKTLKELGFSDFFIKEEIESYKFIKLFDHEAVGIIELLMWYGSIHTITGVRYPEGTHEEVLKRAANYLNKVRDKIFKTKEGI